MGEGEGFLAKSVLLANVNSKTRFVYAHACVCVSARECARMCSDESGGCRSQKRFSGVAGRQAPLPLACKPFNLVWMSLSLVLFKFFYYHYFISQGTISLFSLA